MISSYCDDLQRVGPAKPLGYLPLDTIRDSNAEDPTTLQNDLQSRGLYTLIVSDEESHVASGALYVADLQALELLLQKNHEVLTDTSWPTDPKAFVYKVITDRVEPETELFNVIADAFADYNNPLRKR